MSIPVRQEQNPLPITVALREIVQIDSVLLPVAASAAVLLDGSVELAFGGIYEVTFNIVSVDTKAVVVTVGIDRGGTGTLAGAEIFLDGVTIPAGGQTGDMTVTLPADDDIFGSAVVADDAAIHFTRIIRVA